MMTVTGAVIVFSTFPGARTGRSLSFASRERRKTNRAGFPLALVGPHFITSYSRRRRSSVTGFSSQALCVRASRNSRSRASSASTFLIDLHLPVHYQTVLQPSLRLGRKRRF